jgi:hypothetical protein
LHEACPSIALDRRAQLNLAPNPPSINVTHQPYRFEFHATGYILPDRDQQWCARREQR